MTNERSRDQVIRARVYDVHELVISLQGPPLTVDELKTQLYVRIAAAQFSLMLYRAATERGQTEIWDGEADAATDELLDRVKGLLEFEVPAWLLHPTQQAFDPRSLVAEIVGILPVDGAVMQQVRDILNLGDAAPGQVVLDELTVWIETVVEATIEQRLAGS